MTKLLHNLHFDVNLLIEEDLLYHFELSLVEIELALPLGIQLKSNSLIWLLTYFLSPFLIDKMWHAIIHKRLKGA